MDYQHQNRWKGSSIPDRRLTPKGRRTRDRIVDAAAMLVHLHGVAGTTLEDVKRQAEVSSSQLYNYFSSKDELIDAVVRRQSDLLVSTTSEADLGTPDGVRAWRDHIIAHARGTCGQGGCPLGSLGSQLAETDSRTRALIATGFDRWTSAIAVGMRELNDGGHLSSGLDPDDLTATVLAVLQGGLLLAQVQRDSAPLQTALDTVLTMAGVFPVAAGSR